MQRCLLVPSYYGTFSHKVFSSADSSDEWKIIMCQSVYPSFSHSNVLIELFKTGITKRLKYMKNSFQMKFPLVLWLGFRPISAMPAAPFPLAGTCEWVCCSGESIKCIQQPTRFFLPFTSKNKTLPPPSPPSPSIVESFAASFVSLFSLSPFSFLRSFLYS